MAVSVAAVLLEVLRTAAVVAAVDTLAVAVVEVMPQDKLAVVDRTLIQRQPM